ncbi:MAG: hypothetical protein MUC82_02540 [Cypionkella sp.]|jgi:phosphotriesterase-related protein|nr:hypothetical protein [Cypionkella sp.]
MPMVQTVTGPVRVEDLGATVTHEHVFLDSRDGFSPRPEAISPDVTVTPATRAEVDRHPLAVLDNLLLDDLDIAVEELSRARTAGLATLVEATSLFTGRKPAQLIEASRRSGVQIVMGSGLYMERAIPAPMRDWSEDALMTLIETDLLVGEDTALGRVRPGVIGEVGVSSAFTALERRSLRAAARVAHGHGVPLSIHLPAWEKLGHAVLDEILAATGEVRGVLLGHLNPMAHDLPYMASLADRGAWLGLDMLGNSLDYGNGRKSPDDSINVANIAALLAAGLGRRLLLSSDVGQKNMLKRNGGQGYAHAIEHIVPQLMATHPEFGDMRDLTIANPRAWFTEAAAEASA